MWLSVWSEVQIVFIWSSWCHCQLITPSSLASFESRLVLRFWYRLTQVVLEKRPLNGCSSSCGCIEPFPHWPGSLCCRSRLLKWGLSFSDKCRCEIVLTLSHPVSKLRDGKKVKVAYTRLLSVGFQSRSRFLAVSLLVMWVINPAVGCHYFLPGLRLPPQPLTGLLPILLLGE